MNSFKYRHSNVNRRVALFAQLVSWMIRLHATTKSRMQIFRHRIECHWPACIILCSLFSLQKPAIPDFNYKHQRLITLNCQTFVHGAVCCRDKNVEMTCIESSSCVYFFNLPNGTKSLTKSKLFQRVSEAHFNSVNISRALKGEKSLPFNLFRGNFSGGSLRWLLVQTERMFLWLGNKLDLGGKVRVKKTSWLLVNRKLRKLRSRIEN